MAIVIKKGGLGTLSGKIGNVVVSTWRDKDVARSTPGKRTLRPEKTETDQGLRLGMITHFLAPLKAYVKIGFAQKSKKNPGFQSAVEYNLQHAVSGDFPDFEIDYSKVRLSEGPLDIAWGTSFTLVDILDVRVTWEVPDTSKIKLTGNEQVQLVLYGEENDKLVYIGEKIHKRAELEVISLLPAAFHGKTIHGWIFFVSADKKSVSNSRYLGKLHVPEKK